MSYQVVELDGRDALVNARDDLDCDGGGVDVIRVEPVTQSRHPRCDLVKLHAFFASIYKHGR
jgi:hypothetical protein